MSHITVTPVVGQLSTSRTESSTLSRVVRHAAIGGAVGAVAGGALSFTALPFIGALAAPIAAAIGGAAGVIVGGIVGFLRGRSGSGDARNGAGTVQVPPPPPTTGRGQMPPPPPPLA